MKKGKGIIVNYGRLFFILILAVLLVSSASAEINATVENETVGKATVWLDSQVKGKLNTLPIDEVALSMLALSADNEITAEGKSVLLNKSVNGECWPSPLCKVKTTALAVLALNRIGENTDKATAWLLDREGSYSTAGISWLLQIDSSGVANCTISHDSKDYKIKLNENKTYSWIGTASPCLSIIDNSYWLSIISTGNCRDKSYNIICERVTAIVERVTAIVSLPYKSQETLYVPSESFVTPPVATVEIRTRCLKEKTATACNYEATLWGAYALMQTKKEYSLLLPYLVDLASDNQKYMSEAFLFILTTETSHA